MTRTIIFDFDGTIADTLDTVVKIVNKIGFQDTVPFVVFETQKNIGMFTIVSLYHAHALKLLHALSPLYALTTGIKTFTIVNTIPLWVH